ncbi:MAG: hypothetical protein ABSH03_16545 [Candidatus Lustribacter sp.]|jgi:hypothetical protein
MSRFPRFSSALLGAVAATIATGGIAAATTYSFTVPVTVTATKNVTSATVTCAVGTSKITFNPSGGNVVSSASDSGRAAGLAAGEGTGSSNVSLHPSAASGTYTGQATVSVSETRTPPPTNYICFATTGTNDAYTTAPVVSGTLPVIVK